MMLLVLKITCVSAAFSGTTFRLASRTAQMSRSPAPKLSTPPNVDITPAPKRAPKFALPKVDRIVLPTLSYASLAGITAGVIHLLQPLTWQGIAMVGVSVGGPLVLVIGQLALYGGSGVVKYMGGMPADRHLQNIALEAASAVGVPAPKVFEISRIEPNAFAASGLFSGDTTVAVTSGLREILTDSELGAVLAHEMGHLLNSDVVCNMHIAAAAAGMGGIYHLGRMLLDSSSRRDKKKKDDEDSSASVGLMLMAAGIASEAAAHMIRLAASRGAELRADQAAAKVYGAEALINALKKIDAASARRPADLRESTAGRAFSHMMISDGATVKKTKSNWFEKVKNSLRTHPPTYERIEALEKAAEGGLVPMQAATSSWNPFA